MAVELASLGLKVEYQDVDKASQSLDKLADSGKRAESAAADLNRVANDNAVAMRKLTDEQKSVLKLQGEIQTAFNGSTGALHGLGEGLVRLAPAIAGVSKGIGTIIGQLLQFSKDFVKGLGFFALLDVGLELGRMFADFVKDIPAAAAQAQRLKTELTGLTGSSQAAEATLREVNGIIKQFGVNGGEAQKLFLRLAEATDGTRLAGEKTVTVFRSLVEAWRGLNLPAQDAQELFEAFARSAEDGRISIQDLSRIGRAAPGVLEAVARASGLTRQQLIELARSGRLAGDSIESFAAAIDNATKAAANQNIDTVSASYARFQTAIENLKEELGGAGGLSEKSREAQQAFKGILDELTAIVQSGLAEKILGLFDSMAHRLGLLADAANAIADGKLGRALSSIFEVGPGGVFGYESEYTREQRRQTEQRSSETGERSRAGLQPPRRIPGVSILPSQEGQNYQLQFQSQLQQARDEAKAIQDVTAASGRAPGSAVFGPGDKSLLNPPFDEAKWQRALENYARVKAINEEILKAKQAHVKVDQEAIEKLVDQRMANEKNLAIDKERAELNTKIQRDNDERTRKTAQLNAQIAVANDPTATGLLKHKQAVDDIVHQYEEMAKQTQHRLTLSKAESDAIRQKADAEQTSTEKLQAATAFQEQITELQGQQADIQKSLTIGVDDYSKAMGEAAIQAERVVRQLDLAQKLSTGKGLDPAQAQQIRDEFAKTAQQQFNVDEKRRLEQPWVDLVEGLHQSFSDLWFNIITKGTAAFKDLTDVAQQLFQQLVTQLISSFTKPFFDQMANSLTQAVSFAQQGAIPGGATTAGSATAADVTGAQQQAAALAARRGGFLGGGFGAGVAGGTLGVAGGSLINSILGRPSTGLSTGLGLGGAVAGGVIGSVVPGIGTFAGSLIGGALGSLAGGLFGGGEDKPDKTRGYGGLSLTGGRPTIDITRANNLGRSAITDLLEKAKDVISGVLDAAGASQISSFTATANFQGRTPRYAVDIADRHYNGPQKPADPRAALDFFIRNYLQYGAQSGAFQGLSQTYQKVLTGLPEHASAEEVTKRVNFAGLYDQLVKMGKPTSDFIQQIEDLHKQFAAARSQAQELGLSVSDLEEAYQRARQQQIGQFNRDIQTQIYAITDPFQAAMRQLDEQQAQRVRDARALGGDLVNVEKLNALERSKVVEQFAQQTTLTLKDWANSLTQGPNSPLAPLEQLNKAQEQFRTLSSRAAGGDAGAFAKIPNLGNNILTLARQVYGASPEFASIFEKIQQTGLGLTSTTEGFTGSDAEGPLTKKAWTESLQPINESFATLIDATQQQTTAVTTAITNVSTAVQNNTTQTVREVRLLRDAVTTRTGLGSGTFESRRLGGGR